MVVTPLANGIVLDHISAGLGIKLYNILGLENDPSVFVYHLRSPFLKDHPYARLLSSARQRPRAAMPKESRRQTPL